MVVFPQTGNRCIVTTGPGIVSNRGAVPAGVVGCVVLCLKEEGKKRESGGGKGRRNLAMKLHKVSDATGGKIKVVASSSKNLCL